MITLSDVPNWSLQECSDYVSDVHETVGELRAEAGMSAMNLGYGQEGAYQAANAVAGPERDPIYVAALERVEAAFQSSRSISVQTDTSDDIPF